MKKSDHRIEELITEFQKRTQEAYEDGGMPGVAFKIQYDTLDVKAVATWYVPELPAGGGGSGKKVTT